MRAPEGDSGFSGAGVLVTGGLGFIGARLAMALVARGARVTVVDSMAEGSGASTFNIEPIRRCVRLCIADARDVRAMRELVAGQDYVFHLAGRTSHADSMRNPNKDLEANCGATLGVLEACRMSLRPPRIVFTSTRQVYGRPTALPVDESHPARPVDVNGVHKLAAERYCELYHQLHGLPLSTVRLTNTYGPRMRVRDARQMFLGGWVRAALEGRPFEVWGGEQRRDLTYVDDAVAALIAVAQSRALAGEVVNVGGDAATLRELADLLSQISGCGYEVTDFPCDRRAIDIGDYVADDGKLRRATGWEPRTPLPEGLAKTVEYYQEHLSHYV